MTLAHPPILGSRHLDWPDEAACGAFARWLATAPELRDACIALHGPLGAGKTTLARHLLQALGVRGRIRSPTYALMERYELPAGGTAAHFDFYRFADPREAVDAGLREVFAAPGLKLVEWPDQGAGLMPVPDLQLRIEPQDDQSRQVELIAHTPRGVSLLPSGAPEAASIARTTRP